MFPVWERPGAAGRCCDAAEVVRTAVLGLLSFLGCWDSCWGAVEKSGPQMDHLLVSPLCFCPDMETQRPACLGTRVLPRTGVQGAAPVLTQALPSLAHSSV